MATLQSGFGKIELFEDFTGPENIVAETTATGALGALRVVGDSLNQSDAGITIDEGTTGAHENGVAVLTTAGDDLTAVGLCTGKFVEIGKMAPLVAEIRIQFADALTKNFVFGLTNENAEALTVETDIISTSGTTLTISADDFVGFWFEAETTAYTTSWHGIYKGGTRTAPTLSTEVDFPSNLIVAGDWQILRFEIDNNGTARWYIDGTLLQTITNACSTTEDLAILAMVADHAGGKEYAYIDYIYVSAYRDWTV